MEVFEIRALACEVAAELGDDWHDASPEGTEGAIIARSGTAERLFIHEEWNANGKLTITGIFPNRDYAHEVHEIGVSASRGAQVIAKEIRRRLNPGYLPDLDRVQRLTAKHDAEHVAMLAVLDPIADRFGTQVYNGLSRPQADLPLVTGDASVEMWHPDAMNIKLRSIRPEIGARLLALLAELNESDH